MAIPSQQIGWSQRAKLLWNIAKQLETLTQVASKIQVTPTPVTGEFLTTETCDQMVTENNDFIILN